MSPGELESKLPMRTEEVADRIQLFTAGKWSAEQRKNVIAVLRMYRHQAVKAIVARAAEEADDSGLRPG
jgi:hypothetical protein